MQERGKTAVHIMGSIGTLRSDEETRCKSADYSAPYIRHCLSTRAFLRFLAAAAVPLERILCSAVPDPSIPCLGIHMLVTVILNTIRADLIY